MNKLPLLFAAALLIFAPFASAQPSQEPDAKPYQIELGSVTLEPAPDALSLRSMPAESRFILQFDDAADEEMREALRSRGIIIGSYIGGNAYYARSTAGISPASVDPVQGLRTAISIDPAMKVHPALNEVPELQQRIQSNQLADYVLVFHDDATADEISAALASIPHQEISRSTAGGTLVEVKARWSDIASGLEADAIQQVEPGLPPKVSHDKLAKFRTNTQKIIRRNNYRKATGRTTRAGLWESARVDEHRDFENRIRYGDDAEGVSAHATSVAGLMAGEGKDSHYAEGQAPDAFIYSYDWDDFLNELSDAADENNVIISNHSWGYTSGWEYDSDSDTYTWSFSWLFQYYLSTSSFLDDLIRNKDLLMVKSAGNDRNEGYIGPWKTDSDDSELQQSMRDSDPTYGSVSGLSNSKNNLVVGALMRDNYMTDFSSWGPTKDGRIKPDVVAPGHTLTSPTVNGSYREFNGTSASAPVVSGAATLLSDYYKKRHGELPGGLLLKGLLIHSGYDLGRPGPDYQFGHGLIDAELAGRVIKQAIFNADEWPGAVPPPRDRDANINALIIDEQITNKEVKRYSITLDKDYEELRATLIWHDPGLKRLVNDIDIIIRPKGGKRVLPWRLNHKKPEEPAFRGRNGKDNVERIDIANPEQKEYIILVKGKNIKEGPERFILIISASDGHRQFNLDNETGKLGNASVFASSDSSFSSAQEKEVFQTGESLIFYSYISVLDNSFDNKFDSYGTVSGEWELTNIDTGKVVFTASTALELEPNNPGQSWIIRPGTYEVPSGMDRGNYRISITWTMTNGETTSASNTFSVQ